MRISFLPAYQKEELTETYSKPNWVISKNHRRLQLESVHLYALE